MRILMLLLICFGYTPNAGAFVDPPTFQPVQPTSTHPITALVRTGICHSLLAPGTDIPPLRIERAPGVVNIFSPGVIAFDGFCNLPVIVNAVAIGQLEAGEYEVRIWIIDASFNFLQTTLVATSPLVVTQGIGAYAIPAMGIGGSVILSVLLLATWRFGGVRNGSLFMALARSSSRTTTALNF